MPEESISSEFREEIRSGHATRERKLAVASGTASLSPEDRVELLAILSADADSMVAERASGALLSQPLEVFVAALGREDAAPALLHYCARNLSNHPAIADALARNPHTLAKDLVAAAFHMTSTGTQALMEELDRVSAEPTLAAALTKSSCVTPDQHHHLEELLTEAHDPTAMEKAVAAAETDPAKRETMLAKLIRMGVPQRVQLALKGNREERMTLIRDPSKVVQRAVLMSPRLTDREVEAFAAMANVSDEVLRIIASNRKYRKDYTVIRNLINNPKTPLDISLHLLPLINAVDLKTLTTNKNVPETLRTTAVKLHRQRSQPKKQD